MEFSFLKTSDVNLKGLGKSYVNFAIERQLKDAKLWAKCVNVFRVNADIGDAGWRGEFWGKMMRGACLVYACAGDEELYAVLENTVRDLLTAQNQENGRISTYPMEEEFIGWDLWSRKYVLTGMLHFREICKDEALKAEILSAMRKHADYVVERIGSGEGKTEICDTSFWWQGLNSATILEPMLALYKLTQEEKYLQFAEYILSTGGLKNANLLELATDNAKRPSEYPVTKAYEMMSFFEGALAYYELTGKEYYLTAVCNFASAIMKHEITVIGCAGCTHEMFDNSAVVQTEEVHEIVGQELCVTVTWMRLLARLYQTTGECWMIDEIERSWINSFGGSLNFKGLKSFHMGFGKWIPSVPFDSYGPLYYTKRNILVGGVKVLPDGSHHGCCASIASAGCAILPLNAVVKVGEALVVNEYFEGTATANLAAGKVGVSITDGYFETGKVTITVNAQCEKAFAIKFRVPAWSKNPTVTLDGVTQKVENGYYTVEKVWKNGEQVSFNFNADLETHYLNGKVCFTYGPFVLARDKKKEGVDIKKPVALIDNAPYVFETPMEDENIRISYATKNGQILLIDYASSGKDWMEEDECLMTVWMDKV